jgi:hypothetical protein
MSDTNTTVEQTLQAFSRYNFDNYCVAHLFVHRDFGAGVLGLAWVADASTLGNAGGICEKQVTAKDLGKACHVGKNISDICEHFSCNVPCWLN